MNSFLKKNRSKLCLLAIAAVALLALLLRSIALHEGFDADIGYFKKGAVSVILTYVLEALGVALCVALPFLINNTRVKAATAAPSTALLIGAIFTALTLPVTAVYLLLKGRTELVAPALVSILAAIFCLLAIGFFLAHFFNVKPDTRALFAYALILAAALLMMIAYLDRYTQTNAPHKLAQHLCMLCIMLAALYEARALIGRDIPRFRLAALALAFFLCSVLAASNVIAFCTGVYEDLTYLVCDLPSLGFAIYCGAKLFTALEKEVEA